MSREENEGGEVQKRSAALFSLRCLRLLRATRFYLISNHTITAVANIPRSPSGQPMGAGDSQGNVCQGNKKPDFAIVIVSGRIIVEP